MNVKGGVIVGAVRREAKPTTNTYNFHINVLYHFSNLLDHARNTINALKPEVTFIIFF